MCIDEINNLPEQLREFPMQIEERFVLSPPMNVTEPEDADFFNHSCEPNCGFRGQIFLVAMRDIKNNEEITFDYAMVVSKPIGSDFQFEMECNCGSTNCRKKITRDDWKIAELQKKYAGYFSEYLQERISYGVITEM